MTETVNNGKNVNTEFLAEITELIEDLTSELHFRGCDEEHRLIQRARKIRRELLIARAG